LLWNCWDTLLLHLTGIILKISLFCLEGFFCYIRVPVMMFITQDIVNLSWVVGRILQISRFIFFVISHCLSGIVCVCFLVFSRFPWLGFLSRFFVTCRIRIGFVVSEIGIRWVGGIVSILRIWILEIQLWVVVGIGLRLIPPKVMIFWWMVFEIKRIFLTNQMYHTN